MTPTGPELDARRRRAVYRATHRGTKEMDVLLGRYAVEAVAGMDEAELASFERLLTLPDPDMERWIVLAPEEAPQGELAVLIARLRRFHGLMTR